MPYEINTLLNTVCETGASSLYLNIDSPPIVRLNGNLHALEGPNLTPKDTHNFMASLTPTERQESIKTKGGTDFAFSYLDKARFRVSILKTKGNFSIILRQIPNKIMTLQDLGLPEIFKQLLGRKKGIILITGPTCSGKTSTLAAILNWINENFSYHILTVEDPIEFYHNHKRSIITQREVGLDVSSFSEAIFRGFRQDPDIIMIGEMRDYETMAAAVTAAETGHLVFASLHTTGAMNTVDRILNSFPADARDQLRTQLSSSILAIISQVLCQTKDNKLKAAFEFMVNTPSIATLIRDGKTYRIPSELQTGSRLGMTTMDNSLINLYKENIISQEELILKANSINILEQINNTSHPTTA